jgi:hypothetical protein
VEGILILQLKFYGTRCRILIGQDILTSSILIKRFYCSIVLSTRAILPPKKFLGSHEDNKSG